MSVQHPERVVTKQDLKDFYDSILPYLGGSEGGGGLLPHIIIISDDGEDVVKAVKGSTEIIATRTSTGHYECDVPEFGTWTIHAVLNGDDAQVNLVVDTVKVYTVDDSHFHADITVNFPVWEATCNLAGQGESYYATSDPYTFTVHSAGTYTITVVEGSNTYTDTVKVTATGQTFSKIIPSPADAPLNNINYWLWYGGIDNSEGDYSTLADILADTTALSALMASHNAVDYLVSNTSWTTSITANEDAMTYIGLNNYCADTLLADSTWCSAMLQSSYKESVLNVKVPTMTSDNTPSGVCSGSGNNSQVQFYHAFDNDTSTYWLPPSGATNNYIGYAFADSVDIFGVDLQYKIQGSTPARTLTIQHGDSNTDIDTLSIPADSGSTASRSVSKPFSNKVNDSKFRLFCSNTLYSKGSWFIEVSELQFYGRTDV